MLESHMFIFVACPLTDYYKVSSSLRLSLLEFRKHIQIFALQLGTVIKRHIGHAI